MRRSGNGIPFARAAERARAGDEELEAELGPVQLIGTRIGLGGDLTPDSSEPDDEEGWSFNTRASRMGPATRLQISLGQNLAHARIFPVRKASARTFFMDVILIGRASTCDVVIDDPSISKLHARLRERDGQWHVSDASSSNGTYVGGKRLGGGEHPLVFGAVVKLGDWALRFETLESTRAIVRAVR